MASPWVASASRSGGQGCSREGSWERWRGRLPRSRADPPEERARAAAPFPDEGPFWEAGEARGGWAGGGQSRAGRGRWGEGAAPARLGLPAGARGCVLWGPARPGARAPRLSHLGAVGPRPVKLRRCSPAGLFPTTFPEPLPFNRGWVGTLPKVQGRRFGEAAVCRQSSKDSRKLSCSEHWGERIWL
ncbi:peptidyl-prolyl cis-trans isomerase A isoform X1 [Rattus norvegicus]|uniref:peptidyl-prolyl cis-trans isomerase A isoform X1 n=1 Tax=Rattus norvegicus TaxID=10116 RepID=UPI002FD7E96C